MSPACLDENAALELLEDGRDAAGARDHLAACSECRRLVSELARAYAAGSPTEPAGAPDDAGLFAGWLPPGTRVGRYEIRRQLGAGAMGAVYAAYDPVLDRTIALKLRRPELAASERATAAAQRERLVREARAMARLVHPNVVAVHDAGEFGDEVFLAMELVEGGTLRSWLAAEPRPWPELARVFAAAGAGLAAAHRAGLTHRDIKPDNILIGGDGRVAVSDFGLAALHIVEPAAAPAALYGTPAYMAPEQLDGAPATPASDQFAFAATLYEAAHGERPYPADSIAEMRAKVRGAPPAIRGLPTRAARALRRALAIDPSERFPTLEPLLAALSPRVRPRWIAALVGGGILAAAAATTAILVVQEPSAVARCEAGSDEIAATWTAPHRAGLVAALLRGGAVYAGDAVRSVAEAGDAYVARWAEGHRDACRAAYERGDQSAALLDARMRCLRARRRGFAEVITGLTRADGDVALGAADAMQRLAPVEDCADVDALAAAPHAPDVARDPAAAARREQLEARLTTAMAKRDIGEFREALAIARELATSSTNAAPDPAVAARAFALQASLESYLSDYEASAQSLARAVTEAEKSRDDVTRARATVGQLRIIGIALERMPEALAMESHAQAVVARSNDRGAAADLRAVRAQFRLREAKHDEALQLFTEALAEHRAAYGEEATKTLATENQLADLHERLAHYDEAERLYTHALAIARRINGPAHPRVAEILSGVANLANSRGDFATARDRFLEVLAIEERALGPDKKDTGTTHRQLGNTYRGLGDRAKARFHLERALAIAERPPVSQETMAVLLNDLGAFWADDDPRRALAYLERALAIVRAGDDQRNAAPFLMRIGLVQHALHDDDAAVHSLESAIAAWESFLGTRHPHIAYGLHGLGLVYIDTQRPALARKPLERALALRAGPATPWQAETQFLLARALRATGQELGRARDLAQRARAYYAATSGSATELAEIDAWLAARH